MLNRIISFHGTLIHPMQQIIQYSLMMLYHKSKVSHTNLMTQQ
jgi:hypothetical protein